MNFIIPICFCICRQQMHNNATYNSIAYLTKCNIWQTLLILVTFFPLRNPFHVLIVAIMLQYHLILIHTLLLAWMIVFIMANAGTLHAKIILKRKRYSSSVLHVWPPIIIYLLTVQQTVCKKASRLSLS